MGWILRPLKRSPVVSDGGEVSSESAPMLSLAKFL